MSPVRPDVRAFFEQYERAGQDLDDCALTSCFCDVFVSLDPNSATAVSPQALLAVLPRRKALFRSIGSDGLELADISEMPLDDAHTLVRTAWTLRMDSESPREDITLLPRLDVAAASAWRYSAHACGDRARATYAGVVFVVAALELYGTSIGGPQIANASSPTLRGHRRGTYSRSTCAIASISTSWSG